MTINDLNDYLIDIEVTFNGLEQEINNIITFLSDKNISVEFKINAYDDLISDYYVELRDFEIKLRALRDRINE